jgi:hypothetical protein
MRCRALQLRKHVFPDRVLALITTLFFVIHPVHCEVVANIKSMDEILAFLFSILALDNLLDYAAAGSKRKLIFSGCCFAFSLFAKESSVLFAALVPMLLYVKTDWSFAKCLRHVLPFGVLTLVFVGVRLSISAVPDTITGLTTDPYFFASLSQKIATVSLVFGKYLLLMVYPGTLIFDYGYNHIPYVSFSNPKALFTLVLNSAILIFAARALIHRQLTGFLLLSYLSGILLLSNLFLNVGPIMAERFVFTPGFFLIVAVLLLLSSFIRKTNTLHPSQPLAILLMICMPFTYIQVTARNADWRDNATLYKADLQKAPDSFRVLAFNGIEKVSGVSLFGLS